MRTGESFHYGKKYNERLATIRRIITVINVLARVQTDRKEIGPLCEKGSPDL